MIDIHILTHSGTREDWLRQCLCSIDGQPCIPRVLRGVEGSVGAGRAKGYALGDSEFVGYVDSDDYLLPGALAACLSALRDLRSVVTLEWVEYEDGTRHPYPKRGHGIAVYRREDIEPLLSIMAHAPHTVDMQVRNRLRPQQLEFVGHVWRVHPAGNHKRITHDLLEQESRAWL